MTKRKQTSERMIFDIRGADAHDVVRELDNRYGEIHETIGKGACSIHSVFGIVSSSGAYYKHQAREFLGEKLTGSVEEFKAMIKEEEIIADLSRVLWQDLVVPFAAREAGMENVRYLPFCISF